MKDFLTIREFSKITGITKNILRWWDEIGVFIPEKRNKQNKYRYYSINQIIQVKYILILKKLGVSLKAIKSLMHNRNPEQILDLMESQEVLINMKLQELNEMFSIINSRRELIKKGLKVNVNEISIVDMSGKNFIFGPLNHFDTNEKFYRPFVDFCNKSENLNIKLDFPIGAYHENISTFFNRPNQPDRFISFDIAGKSKWNSGKYLTGYIYSYYGEIDILAKRLQEYAIKNSIGLSGPVYTVCLHDETCVSNHDDYLIQVSIAIK